MAQACSGMLYVYCTGMGIGAVDRLFKILIMKKNMGGLDRMIRFIVAIVVIALYYFKIVDGTLAYVLLGLSGIFILTSFVSFCPLYSLFGLNTCKVKE